ncbi:MAG: molybdopterin-dependent oxidoreductase [Promethearchaeota archaeon]
MDEIIRRFGTCSKDCYGSCVFHSEWNDNAEKIKFLGAIPSKNHPFTQGLFCSKLNERESLVYHPERIINPLKHVGVKDRNEFHPIGLEAALTIITEKLGEIKRIYGPESIVAAFSAGNYGLISRLAPLRFFNKLGATITTGGICNEGGCNALEKLLGTYSTTNPLQLKSKAAKIIVIWGSNLPETNIHAYNLIKKAMKNGSLLIVIDSRNHQLAQEAHFFIQPYPGMEYLVAKLIINQIFRRNGHNVEFLSKHVENTEKILSIVGKFDVEKALQQTGVDANKLNEIIDLLIQHKHETIFNVGYGIQKYYHGGDTLQLIALLQVILGNFGSPGTGLVYSQSDFNKSFIRPIEQYITKNPPIPRNNKIMLIDLGWALNSPKYKMIFIYNFNPASSLPNQNLVRRTLSRDDLFVIVLDMFLNQTTKYADIVIPAKFGVENDDIYAPYYIPGVSINEGGPCPYPNCLTNYEFFQKLAYKIGWQDDIEFQESQKMIMEKSIKLLPRIMKEDISEKGYHSLFDEGDVPFKEVPFLSQPLKLNLDINLLIEDFVNYETFPKDSNQFYLISPSHVQFLHSQLGQIHSNYLNQFEKIFLHSSDIERLNFQINKKVTVSNRYGEANYILDEKSELKPGVALIYSGSPFGFNRNLNVNLFTPQTPEKSHFSGSFNSATIRISQ